MSDVLYVTDRSEFQDLLDTEQKLVVDFYADWCGPCKQFDPHFKTASEKSDATFVKVDVDSADWAMVDFGVLGIPSVKLFTNGDHAADLKSRNAIHLLAEINSH